MRATSPLSTRKENKLRKRMPIDVRIAQAYDEIKRILVWQQECSQDEELYKRTLAEIEPQIRRLVIQYQDKHKEVCAEYDRKASDHIHNVKNNQGRWDRFWGVTINTHAIQAFHSGFKAKALAKLQVEHKNEELKIYDSYNIQVIDNNYRNTHKGDIYYDSKCMYLQLTGNAEDSVYAAAFLMPYTLCRKYRGRYYPVGNMELLKEYEHSARSYISKLEQDKVTEQALKERSLRIKYGIGDDVLAAAAAHFGTTRELADKIKGALRAQLAVTKDCPYCGLPLGDAIHADHIYPVSKGGLSTPENMVLICEQCNLKKHSKTLRQFMKAYKLDEERIEAVLELLHKHF